MNFSNNSKLRKLLGMTLVLVMTTTMLTGCFGSKEAEDTSEPAFNLNLAETTGSTTAQTEPTETTEAAVINENTATVTSQLNIRSSPSTEATIVGTLYAGDKVEVSRREEVTGIDWAYIISPEAGWIVMDFVEMDIPTEEEPGQNTSTPAGSTTPTETTGTSSTQSIKGVVNANGLNIRSEASTNATVQGSYNKGDVVTILETKNGWGRTNKGWIKMDYVSTSGSTTTTTTTTNTTTNNTTTTTDNTTGNGSTTVILKGIVKVTELNIRSSASTEGDRLGSYTYGTRVEILEKSGSWGRTSKGWIHLDYIYQDGTTGTKTASGTVTGTQLNIRSGPGTGYGSVGSYNQGDSVSILEQFTYNGTTWGCTSKGWICLDYVELDGVSVGTDQTGTITGNGLNIRSGPGTGYASVGSLNSGDRVTIYKTTTVDGITWGNISQGWISMAYVDLD